MRRCLTVAGFASALWAGAPVHAENTRQQWLTLTGEFALDPNDSVTAAAIFRSEPDSFDVGQRLLRLGFTHRLEDGVSLNAAYTHVRSMLDGAQHPVQHRLSQSLGLPLGTLGKGKLDARLQLEEVLLPGLDSIGVRFRPRVRWQQKLDAKGRFEIQISDEIIWSLNSTRYGQNSGFAANRAAGSVRWEVNPHLGISPGYTWQLINRSSGPVRNDHIVGLTFDTRF